MLFFASFRDSPTNIPAIKPIPFETIEYYFSIVLKYSTKDFVSNIFGNIFLFAPFGFLGIILPKLKNGFWLMFYFFITINIIEFSQYFTNRGYADVDDVILNSLGVFLGFIVYKKTILGKLL